MTHSNAQQSRPGQTPRRRGANNPDGATQLNASQAASQAVPQATSKQPTKQQSSAVLQYPEQPPQYQGIRSYVPNSPARWQPPPIPTLDEVIAQLEAESAPEPEQQGPVAGIATSLKFLRKKLF